MDLRVLMNKSGPSICGMGHFGHKIKLAKPKLNPTGSGKGVAQKKRPSPSPVVQACFPTFGYITN